MSLSAFRANEITAFVSDSDCHANCERIEID